MLSKKERKSYKKTMNDYIKSNLLALAKDHKDHCESPNCGVNLYAVRLALKGLGITVSEEESAILF